MADIKANRSGPQTNPVNRVLIGTVVSTHAFANCYMISFGEGEGRFVRPCLYVGSLGNSGQGAREIAPIVNGALVAVMTTVAPFDYIIAVIPLVAVGAGITPVEFAQQGGGAHFFTEEIQRFTAMEQSGVINASSGGVVDAFAGDWGVINELGIGTFVGRFEAFLRVDEMCGVWANYVDKSLRVAARNYLFQTYGADDYDGFTDGELNAIRRRAAYPAESVGIRADDEYSRVLPTFTQDTGRSLVNDRDGTVGPTEPISHNQVLLPRLLELEGRNADLYQRYALTPVPGSSYLLDNKERYLGLFRERVGLDGSYQIYSKSSISIRKVVTIPAPIDVQDMREPGKEITDQIIADFDWSENLVDKYGSAAFAAQSFEYHAYISNLEGFRNLIGRSDWHIPEAQDPILIPGPVSPPVNRTSMWQVPAAAQDVPLVGSKVAKMYLANSGIDILPDGTVVIDGPAGEQIRMGGGNIILTCPGSVYTLPGQSAITWAPGDIIQRAKDNVELSTSVGDVRIKAEKNVQMLAGNNGIGGILLESKGAGEFPDPGVGTDTEAAGIVLKSSSAIRQDAQSLTMLAGFDGIRMRTDTGRIDISAIDMLLDIEDSVIIDTGDRTHMLSASFTLLDTDTLLLAGALGVAGSTSIGTGLLVEDGGVDVNGSVLIHEDIVAGRDIVSGRNIAAANNLVGALAGEAKDLKQDIDTIIDRSTNEANATLKILTDTQQDIADAIAPVILNSDEFWADYQESVSLLAFTFRRDEDYTEGHDLFALPESRWQAWIRDSGVNDKWSEPVVSPPEVSGAIDTIPHPGLRTWNSEGLLIQAGEGGLWDSQAVLPSNRDTGQAVAQSVPLSQYIINTDGNA